MPSWFERCVSRVSHIRDGIVAGPLDPFYDLRDNVVNPAVNRIREPVKAATREAVDIVCGTAAVVGVAATGFMIGSVVGEMVGVAESCVRTLGQAREDGLRLSMTKLVEPENIMAGISATARTFQTASTAISRLESEEKLIEESRKRNQRQDPAPWFMSSYLPSSKVVTAGMALFAVAGYAYSRSK